MLIPLLLLVFAVTIIPAICVHTICRNDLDPSIQVVAMLILTPFFHFLVLVLRRNV